MKKAEKFRETHRIQEHERDKERVMRRKEREREKYQKLRGMMLRERERKNRVNYQKRKDVAGFRVEKLERESKRNKEREV